MNNSVSYLTLFKTFTKLGIVTFGGGYAMIPIIESKVVDKHHWMTKEEFLDAIAVTQTCPGALAINMSSMLGYKLAKVMCALLASENVGTAIRATTAGRMPANNAATTLLSSN